MSFKIKIADLVVEMDNRYGHVEGLCKDFFAESDNCDLQVMVTEEEISEEMKLYSEPFGRGYCESVCLYRNIAEQLPGLDRFVFHGAAVKAFGKGFLFTAPSGTGKSTHVELLTRYFGEEVSIINGDKPILGFTDGKAYVYSCPWAGKEGWKTNTCAPIGGIILLRRGADNSIRRIDPSEYFEELMAQVYIPKNSGAMLKTLSLVDSMAKAVPFYLLECNMTSDAAKTSFSIMK